MTAHGMVLLYGAVLRDPKVGPWLRHRMHHYRCAAADGTNQCFGISAATSGAAVKQGWGSHSADSRSDAVVNSTGLVGDDRYAVAILTEGDGNASAGDLRGYNHAQGAVVTQMARILMPGGEIDPAREHNPTLRVGQAGAVADQVALSGWAYDPDQGLRPATVTVYDGSTKVATANADLPTVGFDRVHGISGGHGFSVRLTAPRGPHTYRLAVDNDRPGTSGVSVTAPRVSVMR